MARVALHDLSKRFGDHTAVDSFSLQIADREFVVLVGPSGCGKTTTLRMIAGFESPDNGSIVIGERDVSRVATKDRNLAMVFQKYALYPHMNVFRNMAFGLKLRKTPKAEVRRRVEQTAEMLGISHLLTRKPADLSGGEQQRVALGRAVARDADVFLFDEPLSNLDAKLRVRMRSEIVKLHRKLQATMVYVTHDQVEAMMMGDRIVVMNEGRIQQVGTPLDVYNSPQNRFVAEFIGSPPMNVLDGQLTNDNDQPAVKIGDWTVPISKARAGRYTELVGKPIALGIRPEDIRLTPPGDGENWLAIESEIQVTQPLGAEWLIELEAHGQSFVARSPASSAPSTPTGSITSHWNLARCHLFDGRTGAAVMGAKEI